MDYNGFVQIVLIFQRKLSKRRFPITFVNSVTNFIFVFRFSSQQKKTKIGLPFSFFIFSPPGNKDCQLHCHWPKKKNEKRLVIRFTNFIRKRKTKKKIKIRFSKVTKKKNGEHKVNSNSVSFPAGKKGKTKMEVQFRFLLQRKT